MKDLQNYTWVIVSMVSLGIGSFIYKRSSLSIGPINTTFFYYLFSVIITFVIWLVFKDTKTFKINDLVWPLLIAVFLSISVLAFNLSLEKVDVSIAATIRSMSFIILIILALVIEKEVLKLKDYIAIGLACGAIVLFGMK